MRVIGHPDAARVVDERDPVIRVQQVVKDFGTTRALDNVDLEVPRGQLLVLVGLSGSGKSTLLRHLNGLQRPDRGSVEVLGTDLGSAATRHLRALRTRVGFVFQQFNQVELALGWAHRLVGLRDGQKVLDRDAAGLDEADVMAVYRRVVPNGAEPIVRRPSAEELAASRAVAAETDLVTDELREPATPSPWAPSDPQVGAPRR